MSERTDDDVEMSDMECCSCHMLYAIPTSFRDQCWEQRPHLSFFCPAGHWQHYERVNRTTTDFVKELVGGKVVAFAKPHRSGE